LAAVPGKSFPFGSHIRTGRDAGGPGSSSIKTPCWFKRPLGPDLNIFTPLISTFVYYFLPFRWFSDHQRWSQADAQLKIPTSANVVNIINKVISAQAGRALINTSGCL